MCYLCWKDTCGDSMSSVPMQRQSIDPRQGLLQSPGQMMYCKCLCVNVFLDMRLRKTKKTEM